MPFFSKTACVFSFFSFFRMPNNLKKKKKLVERPQTNAATP